jgi:glyoxylase-like metal-dependent hydrolase (beta-lactamase superfamily II)
MNSPEFRPQCPERPRILANSATIFGSSSLVRGRPVAPIPDEMSLQAFGVDGKVLFTPGHTAGSISVLLSSGEAIVGDLLMGGWLGGMFRSGQPGYPYFADELGQIQSSVRKLLDLRATKFFVGHGGPLDAGRVGKWLERAVAGRA